MNAPHRRTVFSVSLTARPKTKTPRHMRTVTLTAAARDFSAHVHRVHDRVSTFYSSKMAGRW